MKKVYIAPSIFVKDVKVQNILAGSPSPKVDTSLSSQTMDSKRGNIFYLDDEEDELY